MLAAQLTSARRRRQLVTTLQRTINEEHNRSLTRVRMTTINRAAVRNAEGAINGLIARLTAAQPVRAEGMAIAERLITDAARSPLYDSAGPGALRREVLAATEALDSAPGFAPCRLGHQGPLLTRARRTARRR
ncbi:MAG: hypothetical protein ABI323_04930 [Solirubrobacteraceae bacterium]